MPSDIPMSGGLVIIINYTKLKLVLDFLCSSRSVHLDRRRKKRYNTGLHVDSFGVEWNGYPTLPDGLHELAVRTVNSSHTRLRGDVLSGQLPEQVVFLSVQLPILLSLRNSVVFIN